MGSYLVAMAYGLGALGGVALMFGAHIWMDYAWLGTTSSLAGRERLFLGKLYRAVLVMFGMAMLYFGITFIISSVLWPVEGPSFS